MLPFFVKNFKVRIVQDVGTGRGEALRPITYHILHGNMWDTGCQAVLLSCFEKHAVSSKAVVPSRTQQQLFKDSSWGGRGKWGSSAQHLVLGSEPVSNLHSHLGHFYSLFPNRIRTLNCFYLLHHPGASKPMTSYFLNCVSFLFLVHRNVCLTEQSCVFFFSKLVYFFFFHMYHSHGFRAGGYLEPWTLNNIATQSPRIIYEGSPLFSVVVFKHKICFNTSWHLSMPKFSTLQKNNQFLEDINIQIQYI